MLTPRTPRSCDGPRGSLSMRPLGLAGQRALQARLARLCRSHRSPSHRRTTGVSPHHTMTCTDVGGRVTDGAGSSVAVEWSDRARAVALRPPPGWCGCVYKLGWLWPLRMAKRLSKRATRGGERQSTEAPSASQCSDVTSAFWRNGASDRWDCCHATLSPSRGTGCHDTLIRSAAARPHTRARASSSSTISAPSLSTR